MARWVFLSVDSTRHLGAELARVTVDEREDLAGEIYKFLEPGERGYVDLDASRDIEELDSCYTHRFFRAFDRYVSVCGLCPPVHMPSLRCWGVLKSHFLTFPENYGFLCLYSDGFGKMYTTDGHVYVGPDFQKIVPEHMLPAQYRKLYMYRDWCVVLGLDRLKLIHVPSGKTVLASNSLKDSRLCVISAAPMQHGVYGLREAGDDATLEFVEILFVSEGQAVRFPDILDKLLTQEHPAFEISLISREEVNCPVANSQFLECRILSGLKHSIRPRLSLEAGHGPECPVLDDQPFVIDDDVILLNKRRRVVFTTKFLE